MAVACVTPRDACWRRCRFPLSLSALTWVVNRSKRLRGSVGPRREARGSDRTHLGRGHELSSARGDFVRTDHQLLKLPLALHHQVGCISAQTKHHRLTRDCLLTDSGGADAYTITVAPQPTALEAEIRPSVQREFLA